MEYVIYCHTYRHCFFGLL